MNTLDIGKRIKQLREALKLNQAGFVSPLRMTQSALSQIESGDTMPSVETLKSITMSYGVTYDWLIHNKPKDFLKKYLELKWGAENFEKLKDRNFTNSFAEKLILAARPELGKVNKTLTQLSEYLHESHIAFESNYTNAISEIMIDMDGEDFKNMETEEFMRNHEHLITPMLDLAKCYSHLLPDVKKAYESFRKKHPELEASDLTPEASK